ncbi:MAG: hypothetical protein HY043_04010 [Verrucomicrobia bacterium]|nr:hypothetical protein [Verrucomicrobiota bacterium]
MTLVETLIGSSIATVVIGGVILLVWQVGNEQRRAIADAALEENGAILQDKIVSLLRSMSATESVIFSGQISGTAFYQRVVLARGKTPAYPREEIYFDATNFRLMHDPDRSVTGNDVALFSGTNALVLRNAYFYPSLKSGGLLDSATLNVSLTFDDNGLAGRRNSTGAARTTTVSRAFTVSFRNP